MTKLKIDPAEYVTEDEILALKVFDELATIGYDALPTLRARLVESAKLGTPGHDLEWLAKDIQTHERNIEVFEKLDNDIAERRDAAEAIPAQLAEAESEARIQKIVDASRGDLLGGSSPEAAKLIGDKRRARIARG